MNQIKAQHKMLRVFFQKFDLFADPTAVPTGALFAKSTQATPTYGQLRISFCRL